MQDNGVQCMTGGVCLCSPHNAQHSTSIHNNSICIHGEVVDLLNI